jgi:hypothetical protein
MRNTGSTMWSFEYAGIDLLRFSLPDIQLIDQRRLVEDPTVNYGTCVLQDGDYNYLYGAQKSGLHKFMHVARCPKGSLAHQWEYASGAGWSTDPAQSKGVLPDVSEQYSVFKRGSSYYLMTQGHILGKEIYLYRGDSPAGPFGEGKLIYCTPQTGGNIFTYNAFYHPQLSTENEICISYNVNSFEFQDLFKNADNYRPWFIRVSGWK